MTIFHERIDDTLQKIPAEWLTLYSDKESTQHLTRCTLIARFPESFNYTVAHLRANCPELLKDCGIEDPFVCTISLYEEDDGDYLIAVHHEHEDWRKYAELASADADKPFADMLAHEKHKKEK